MSLELWICECPFASLWRSYSSTLFSFPFLVCYVSRTATNTFGTSTLGVAKINMRLGWAFEAFDMGHLFNLLLNIATILFSWTELTDYQSKINQPTSSGLKYLWFVLGPDHFPHVESLDNKK